MSSQALLLLVFAGCGREYVSEPFTPSTREAGDTVGVLRAVALAIAEMNARAEAMRSASDFPGSCRHGAFLCTKIETTDWYVSTTDRAAIMLTDLLGVRVTRQSPPVPPPACPWPSRTPDAGFRAAVTVRFSHADSAEVVLTRKCLSSGGRYPSGFGAHEAFEVVRSNGAWNARLTEVGMT